MGSSPGARIVFGLVVAASVDAEIDDKIMEMLNEDMLSPNIKTTSAGWEPYIEYIFYVPGTELYQCVNGAWKLEAHELRVDHESLENYKRDMRSIFNIDEKPMWLVCPQCI